LLSRLATKAVDFHHHHCMLSLVQTPPIARRPVPLDRTRLAADWLLDSGICRPGFGVAEEYRTDGRKYTPASKRATAYYVRTLLWLFETHGETRYIDRALTAAQYLSRCSQHVNGPVMAGGIVNYDRSANGRLDECNAMLRALVESWQASQHSEFLTTAIECANAMRCIPGLCRLESARGWLELAEATGNAQWQEPYDRALAWSLSFYGEFFESGDGERAAPNSLTSRCGFLEALLAHLIRPRNRSGEAVRVFERVFALTSKGVCALPREAGSENAALTEACARLLRLRLHAAGLGLVKLDAVRAECEAGRIQEMQADDFDPRIRGGFYAARPSNVFSRVVGLTSTVTSLQALEQWQQYQDGSFRPALLPLV
jgi:hypothetical protein